MAAAATTYYTTDPPQQPGDPFPDYIYNFPTYQWSGIVFLGPQDIATSSYKDCFKLHWVARELSRKWTTIIDSRDTTALAQLSLGDFALAVFDKVAEMIVYTRRRYERRGYALKDADTWMGMMPLYIEYAAQIAMVVLRRRFDEKDLARFNKLDEITPFILGGVGCMWEKFVDSMGSPPSQQGYGQWADWVDPHIPALDSLPPRPFTKVNHDPAAEPVIVWLNHNSERVPTPDPLPASFVNAIAQAKANKEAKGAKAKANVKANEKANASAQPDLPEHATSRRHAPSPPPSIQSSSPTSSDPPSGSSSIPSSSDASASPPSSNPAPSSPSSNPAPSSPSPHSSHTRSPHRISSPRHLFPAPPSTPSIL
ncbi:hypothetical protein CC85DRAFT_284272 [Cutaneotrichosporon oleaginosum]|uniref:Uncharacterized protein n=1 Tax=Cutaneotrichosporon oleaginosum TaxID=879819 RepID=A0A0J1B7N1_9TREE|nr:uncharacterized protein CC85DRAFT_284272 [Cutaneotrichosporon oleaginosum]KLT43764.1 hypothetical protein CC85DRAFT_284272 [Cutaneotrichosporon oleaginosum]